MKLKHLFARRRPAPRSLYGAIVAAARRPELYINCGVADRPEQRLALIIVFLCLAVNRLQTTHAAEMQSLVELFTADIEGNLRELGISDVAIPRHMRDVEGRYVKTLMALQRVLPGAENGEKALQRELLTAVVTADHPDKLAECVISTYSRLAVSSPESILAGQGFVA